MLEEKAIWSDKGNKYVREILLTQSETTVVESGKAAHLEIYEGPSSSQKLILNDPKRKKAFFLSSDGSSFQKKRGRI